MKTAGLVVFCVTVALLGFLSGISPVQSQTVDVSVAGSANLFGAGHAVPPGDGSLPPLAIEFAPGPDKFINFLSVTGSITSAGYPFDADGSPLFCPTDVNSTAGIAGIIADRTLFLAGVFLEAGEPANPPARLDFSTNGLGREFTVLSPAIAQTFYIGYGRTLTNLGACQRFVVPPTATRLFLGIVDAWDGSAVRGDPGAYFDNTGAYEVRLALLAGAPPWLTISRVTNAVAISWPSPSTDYGLEQTPALSGSSWNSVTNTPADDGTVKSVTLPVQPGNKFFRLKKP